jgi:phosphatidylglycerophosphate synthase
MVARSETDTGATLPKTRKVTGSPFDPLVRAVFPRLAARTPRFVTPNMVTVSGLVATLAAGLAVGLSRLVPELLFVAAALVFVNWITDTLDGVLARQRGQCSRLGDYFDHIFDAVTCAALIVGTAFSGLADPAPVLLLGVLFLLCFAITYKGEHVTGVYELLTFGPTEVRFALIGVYVGAYFVHGPVVTVAGWAMTWVDVAASLSCAWALGYALILAVRYGRKAAALGE